MCRAIEEIREEEYQKGHLEGKQEGKQEGRFEIQIEIAKKMCCEKESMEKIILYTGLSEEDIKEIW